MKLSEIYAMDAVETSHALFYLATSAYNHIKDSGLNYVNLEEILEARFIECRVVREFKAAPLTFWRVVAVFFKDEPVMVVMNGGRKGRDVVRRYISDQDRYLAMCEYLRSLTIYDLDDAHDADEDIEEYLTGAFKTLLGVTVGRENQ